MIFCLNKNVLKLLTSFAGGSTKCSCVSVAENGSTAVSQPVIRFLGFLTELSKWLSILLQNAFLASHSHLSAATDSLCLCARHATRARNTSGLYPSPGESSLSCVLMQPLDMRLSGHHTSM